MRTPVASPITAPAAPAGAAPAGEGKEGEPVTGAAAATPQEPQKPLTWEKPKFGILEAGTATVTPEVQKYFTDNIQIIAEQLRGAHQQGKSLTDEQRKFLELLDEDPTGEKLIRSESGAAAAHMMIEQEVFLQLAAVKKKIEIIKVKNPATKIEDEIAIDELRGWLNKHGSDVAKKLAYILGGTLATAVGGAGVSASAIAGFLLGGPAGAAIGGAGALAAEAVVAGGVTTGFALPKLIESWKRTGKIKISDLTIDTSQFPDAYKDYIEYTANRIDVRRLNKFLLNTAEGQLTFYKILGVNVQDLNSLTPWERLGLGGGAAPAGGLDEATQNLATHWMRDRLDNLRRSGALPAGHAERAARFLKAHSETIIAYANERLVQLRTEQYRGVQGSITKMRATRDLLKNPQEVEKRKAAKKLELEKAKTDLQGKETELTDITKQIEATTREQAKLTARQPTLNAELDRITNPANGALKKIEDEIGVIVGQRDTAITHFDAQIAAVNPTDPDAAVKRSAIADTKAQRVRDFEGQIEEKRKRETALNRRGEEIRTELGKLAECTADLAVLNPKKTTLEGDVKKLKTKIKSLDKYIESGLARTEQKKIDQLEAAIQGLGRYTTVTGNLARSAVTNLSISRLTKRGDDDEGGTNYRPGYLRTLQLLFNYSLPPENIKVQDFFNAARTLLSPDELARLLMKPFGIAAPAPAAAPVDLLDYVYNQIQTSAKPTQSDFNEAFFSILEHIERKGLRIS